MGSKGLRSGGTSRTLNLWRTLNWFRGSGAGQRGRGTATRRLAALGVPIVFFVSSGGELRIHGLGQGEIESSLHPT